MHAQNIYTALRPLLIFSKIFGLYPNKTAPNGGKWEHCSKIDLLWSVIFMVTSTTYIMYSLEVKIARDNDELITEIGDLINLSVSLLNCAVTTIVIVAMRKKVTILCNLRIRIHRLEPSFDIGKEYAKAKKYITSAVIVVIFLSVLYTVIDVNLFLTVVTFRSVGIEVVAYLYPLLTITITVMQFVTLALLVKQKFKWINLKLAKSRQQWHQSQKGNFFFFSPRKSRSISPAISRTLQISEKTATILENLRHRHYELCSISQDLNTIYTVPILLTCLYLFISITFTIYFSFMSSSEFRTRSPVLYSVYYIVKGSIDCAALFALVNASSRTRSEVLEFSIIG
ncbi:7tm 7 domain containing protein [Asbolus verrucosus]|uniref:Gustatory receptor n=1 Tax=Asbolus verrucosus TaxID=1661398 RepID=A0A482W9Y6_ASBVE|nr:7tm 7 domain containing protein [Asbolus verrucosus]